MEKIALITGASRGIGAATALRAAQQGWAVAVSPRPGLINTGIHASGGTADPVAQTIVWLMSGASHYTTMSLLDISGDR